MTDACIQLTLSDDISLEVLAERTEGYSGADVTNVCSYQYYYYYYYY